MEKIIKLKEIGSILGLRELAKQINSEIRKYIDENKNIIFDFEKVNSISSSFADELIAKTMFEIGQEKYLNLVKIRNANNFIKTMINASIANRAKDKKNG